MTVKMKHVAAIAFIMDNVNCRPKAEPLDHLRPAIKEKLPKVGVTARPTDLGMTVCLCNAQPFFTPLADWWARPSHLKTPAPVAFAGFHVWRTEGSSFLVTLWPLSHPWPCGSLGRDRLRGRWRVCTRQKIRIHRHINISHSYNTGKQTQHVSHETDKQVKLQPPGQPIRSDSEISPQCSPQVHYFSRTCQLWMVILICLRPLPCLLTLAGDLLLCECDTAVLEIFNKTLNILDVTFCTCCRWSLSFGMVWRLCLEFQDGWSQKVKQRRTSVFISQIWNRMLKPNHFKVLNHHIYPDDRAHMTKVLPGSSCFVWTTSNDVILIDIAAKTGK